ncbi:MAG: hypothetical protein KIT43_00180 [Bauldia sp.]|nr:hypothetical protein [Bauldia sp.]MCW5718013.1 hypothetical protein [Bauldia sp.]
MKKLLTGIAAAALLATTAAQAQVGGNLAAPPAVNIELALTGAGPALSETTFNLITGDYYRLTITTDGGAEVLFTAPTFMQNIWMNQIVVAGMEIKLFGGAAAVAGVEVGEGGAGNVQITFVPIRPGTYPFWLDEEAGIGGTFIVE